MLDWDGCILQEEPEFHHVMTEFEHNVVVVQVKHGAGLPNTRRDSTVSLIQYQK